MKVLMINSVCGIGSTGRICTDIAQEIEKNGDTVKIAYGRNSESIPEHLRKYAVRIGSDFDVKLHGIYSRITDKHGFGSKKVTRKFLKWADEYNPDILWLHNIHGYYINIEMLFNWIKSRPNMKIKWTLHDCWAFTGHCSYFTMVKCDKWRSHCSYCQQKNEYPKSIFKDNSYDNFERKKKAFTGVKDMTIITPSKWLADLVKESFLKEYPVEVHYNKIDKTIFKPTPSDFRKKYNLEDKIVILGVASTWDKRKGLDDFIELSRMCDNRYAFVLVGLSDKQIKAMPDKIDGLKRTNSPSELAKVYTMADLFVNPSREETFGMTTLEAESCGTDAIVYEDTACEEVVRKFGGVAVPQNVKFLYKEIIDKTQKNIKGGGNSNSYKEN